MKNKLKALLIFAALFYCYVKVFPAVTSGADFLKIPRSARSIALGESYTAAINDIAAIDYNPAVLNTMKNAGFSMMYQTWIDNSYGIYGAGAYRLGPLVFGSSLFYYDYGGIKEYDYLGNSVNSYNPYDMNIKAAVSADGGFLTKYLKGFSAGACISGVYRSLIDTGIFGAALDAGLHYQTTLSRLFSIQDAYLDETIGFLPINAGVSIQNIGFSGDSLSPMKLNIGLSAGLFRDFVLSFDISKEIEDIPLSYKLGAEYAIYDIVFLRAGFKLGRDAASYSAGFGNFSAGFGVKYPFLFNSLRFDYAFSPLGTLGYNHSFSLYGEFLFNAGFDDYYQKGIVFYNKQDYLKARELFRQALNLDPWNLLLINRIIRTQELIRYNLLESEDAMITNYPYPVSMGEYKEGVTILDQYVTFYFLSGTAANTNVVLNINTKNWKDNINLLPDTNSNLSNHVWTLRMKLQKGIYEYRFVINDKKTILDVSNPVFVTDKNTTNSILVIDYNDTNLTSAYEIIE